MPLPGSILKALPAALGPALPAAAALLAYADARFNISTDISLLHSWATSRLHIARVRHSRKVSSFYLLEANAESIPSNVFLVYEGHEYTYSQAYDLVLKHATWLKERHGVKERDIVALDFTNKPAYIWLWFGLWALGAAPAMINYNLVGDRLVHCVKGATTNLVIVDEEVSSVLDQPTLVALEEEGKRQVIVFDDSTQKAVATWNAVRPDDSVRSGLEITDLAMLIYTSGTTGLPKPAVVTFQKICYAMGFCSPWLGLGRDDRFYTCMPLYHSSAAILGLHPVLFTGATLVLGHKFSTRHTMSEIRESRATIMQYVGETCRYLLAAPPSSDDKNHSLRLAFGNGLRSDVWRPFKERFGIPAIAEFYASTEGVSASWNFSRGEFGVGAIGRNGLLTQLVLGRGVQIVKLDPDTDAPLRDPVTGFCTPAARDEPGELIWRLDPKNIGATFQGYYKKSEATREKVLRDVFKKGDAWFRTGDVQKRTSDGLWYFVDRIGDTFRWKSENVSTAEVADVVGSHPAVEEAAVYGVALPNHDGRCGCAAIVLKPGHDEIEVMNSLGPWVKERLPKFARPIFVRIVETIERTGNNKQVKHVLQAQGADPAKVGNDRLWWLGEKEGEGYARFGEKQWRTLVDATCRL